MSHLTASSLYLVLPSYLCSIDLAISLQLSPVSSDVPDLLFSAYNDVFVYFILYLFQETKSPCSILIHLISQP